MEYIFAHNSNHHQECISSHTRSNSRFYNLNNPKTTNYGLETLRCLGPKIWNMIPSDIKSASTLSLFKQKIHTWVPTQCPCRLCIDYIPNLGYLNVNR